MINRRGIFAALMGALGLKAQDRVAFRQLPDGRLRSSQANYCFDEHGHDCLADKPVKSAAQRAMDIRDELDNTQPPTGGKALRRARELEAHHKLGSIASVVSLRVSRTVGDNNLIVQLIDVDGGEVSLWCDSGEMDRVIPVRFVSPY